MNRMLNMDAVNVPILITNSTHAERRAWGRFWKTSMLIIDRKEWKQYLMTCCVQNEATAESLLRYSIDRYRLKSAHLKRKLQPLNLLLPFVKFCSGLTIPHSNEISGSHVKQEPLSNHSFSVNSDSNWLWPFQSWTPWKWTVVHVFSHSVE